MNIEDLIKQVKQYLARPEEKVIPSDYDALSALVTEQRELINTLLVRSDALDELNKTLDKENNKLQDKVESAIVFLRAYCICNNNLCPACRVIEGALKA